MLSAAPIVLPVAAVEEAKAYLRIVGGEEDPMLGGLMRSALELCEQFTGTASISRTFTQSLPASAAWTRLGASPVRSIAAVEALAADSSPSPLAASAYAIDIDANGDGWVRVTDAGTARQIRVTFEAGFAPGWAGIPESLRQGTVRLAAHLYIHRDLADDKGPPAPVTALWRPWRRMRLS